MFQLDFKNVGREKKNFTEKTKDIFGETLEEVLRKNVTIMSSYIDFVFKSENDEVTIYNITAGIRSIGTMEIRDLKKKTKKKGLVNL
jgi:hypothetical protein